MFECQNLTYKSAQRTLLNNINLCFERNKITAIIGANGAGKSTLFKALLGELGHCDGAVLFQGHPLLAHSLISLAEHRAFVAQQHNLSFSLPVFEYLLMAREHIHESMSTAYEIVQNTSVDFQILHLLEQDITRLSGGEAQLVEFTRAYLQLCEHDDNEFAYPPEEYGGRNQTLYPQTLANKCLLLDEPASALDIKQTKRLYQHLLMFKNQGATVILIDHDVNAMASIADNIVLIKGGMVLAAGPSEKVFAQSHLNACFDVQGTLYQPTIRPSSSAQSSSAQSSQASSLLNSHSETSVKAHGKRHPSPIFHVDISV
ncbi:ATP-binding cassette domain-containing protein [Glaciecola sp. SC05]|uniref:ATP-binding cassette domain-containing protein n=1 Tax=Glaciecola sp. SC05 TaxID=1987355 RepID=UPI0035283975